jgi:hypothetical protein
MCPEAKPSTEEGEKFKSLHLTKSYQLFQLLHVSMQLTSDHKF